MHTKLVIKIIARHTGLVSWWLLKIAFKASYEVLYALYVVFKVTLKIYCIAFIFLIFDLSAGF